MTLPSVHQEITELDPPVLPVPEDTLYLGDRLDQILAELNRLREATIEGQRPRPTLKEVLFYDGVAVDTPFGQFSTSTRLRVETVFPILSGTTSIMTLNIGTRKYRLRVNTGSNSVPLPFPIMIDAGIDVFGTVATLQAAGTIGGFYIIAYPDGADE